MRFFAIALLLLAGCASKNPIREYWKPADQATWEKTTATGVRLSYRKGGIAYVSGPVMQNILDVKRKLEDTSGVRADLALVDTEAPNAFAFQYQGRKIIALSLSYLDHLGNDRDALAATIGHELAHLHLGHSGKDDKDRENKALIGGYALGAALNAVGVPLGGLIADIGVTGYYRSFSRDEERAADDHGLEWAVAAGFDPCGHARVVEVFKKLGPGSVPLLGTHPTYGERSERANEFAVKAGRNCY